MPSKSRLALLLVAAIAAAPVVPSAQEAPPPDFIADALPEPGDAALEPGDPPARVGRVARLTGAAAELRLPGEASFRPARTNEPLIGGQAVATPPGGRAELDFGATRLFLDGDTALELAEVPEGGLRAVLGRGAALVRMSGAAATGETTEIVIPDGTVRLPGDGRVLIEAGAPGRPTRIAVFEGDAEIETPVERLRLARGEAVVLAEGAPPRRERAGTGTALVAWATGATPRRAPPVAARGMTGADDLGIYGAWQQEAQYGDVWYPRGVDAGWVPFSDGAWEWRDPWGWTWIDAAPWGFATAHYGRWVRVGPRWGWAPAPVRVGGFGRPGFGPVFRPVFAPATVAFFGAPPRPGFGRPVGWVPLGPREPFFPWFRASPAFVQRANLRTVVNVREVGGLWAQRGSPAGRAAAPRDGLPRGLESFANRRAATVVPEDTLLRSRPVAAVARRPNAAQAAGADGAAGLPGRADIARASPADGDRGRRSGEDSPREADRARDAAAPGAAPGPAPGAGLRREPVPREVERGRATDAQRRDDASRAEAARRTESDRQRALAGEPRRNPATGPESAETTNRRAAEADAERQRAAQGERRRAEAERQRAAEAGAERQRAAQVEGERRRAEADRQRAAQAGAERQRAAQADGERQRQAQAQRDAAQQQRAAEFERQRAVERQRPEGNVNRGPDREAGTARQDRAAQRQQERGERR